MRFYDMGFEQRLSRRAGAVDFKIFYARSAMTRLQIQYSYGMIGRWGVAIFVASRGCLVKSGVIFSKKINSITTTISLTMDLARYTIRDRAKTDIRMMSVVCNFCGIRVF